MGLFKPAVADTTLYVRKRGVEEKNCSPTGLRHCTPSKRYSMCRSMSGFIVHSMSLQIK